MVLPSTSLENINRLEHPITPTWIRLNRADLYLPPLPSLPLHLPPSFLPSAPDQIHCWPPSRKVYNNFAGVQVQEKIFDKAERRIWNMTYLDEGFRVLYGRQESMPVGEGFIFVMERDPASMT